jgi:hypothetical protein
MDACNLVILRTFGHLGCFDLSTNKILRPRNANLITIQFAAWYRGAALSLSKTTVAMAMLAFDILDHRHDTCASIRRIIKSAFLDHGHLGTRIK